jgi:hypothetical protein
LYIWNSYFADGFKSTAIGSQPQETTFGLYVGVGKSAYVKGISLTQPSQTNIGTTNVIGK